MFTRFFIDRPIFAAVLSIIIVLAGLVPLPWFAWIGDSLPIAQYPEITPPTVEVSTVYPGANAKVVADTVASPIEQQVNGVEDMMYMSSQSTNDGTYTLTVTFKPGTDLNIAQVLVQNRVNLAQPVLPDLVKRRGVTVKKKSPSQLMIVNLYSPGGSQDNLYLSNYATIQLRDELSRLEGVGDIAYLGQRDYSMRVWLDPEKMAGRNLSASDIITAVQEQNVQVAAGQVGQPPAPRGQAFQYTINTLGRLAEPEQFEDMILKTDDDGRVIRLRDVARIEMGALGYDQTCTLNGQPSVALAVYQLPGTNALRTAARVKEKMAELKDRFPKGMEYAIVYDTTPFIEESIREVFKTLRDAVILVAVVMLVFLQSWRAAIIPLAAVPVAIIGTFAPMYALGYSINNLTLFGLVLAVGIVVDDAIVVVEAVQHHIDRGLAAREATAKAMDEVAGPVVAVGLVLAAVFVPCVFITGIVGEFFRQFAVTIAVSTLISAFNSLTLSPALCALLLKPAAEGNREPLPRAAFALAGGLLGWLYLTPYLAPLADRVPANAVAWMGPAAGHLAAAAAVAAGAWAGWVLRVVLNRALGWAFAVFNRGFDAATAGYLRGAGVALKLSLPVLALYGGLLFLTYRVLSETPTGFIPAQDKGYLLVNVQLPDSASLVRTDAVMREAERVARGVDGVRHTVSIGGQSALLGANAPNFGSLYVMLDDFPNRHDHDRHADAVAAKLQAALVETIPGAMVNVFGAPPVDGLGTAGGFKLIIESPGTTDATELEAAGRRVVEATAGDPGLADVFTGFRADTPWLHLEIDRVEAKTKGVSIAEVINTLQVYFGSLYINDFNRFGRTWQVNVQAEGNFRQKVEDLKRLKVRSDRAEEEQRMRLEDLRRRGVAPEPADLMASTLVPLGTFVKVKLVSGPVLIQRYNLYPAAAVNATPAAGTSSGEAIAKLEAAAKAELPVGMKPEWTELALLQLQTADTAMKAFALAVVLVFLVLAAQYESWALPLAVILVVPMCLLSAVAGVRWADQDINIFTQVGFVVLVGLACKNAILIVEFAKQKRDDGLDRREATLAACRLRLRPIVMTSVAFILGVVPLVLAEGAGAEMRRTLGTAVFAGMIGVTLFGLLLTPVFFYSLSWATDRLRPLVFGPPDVAEPVPESPAPPTGGE